MELTIEEVSTSSASGLREKAPDWLKRNVVDRDGLRERTVERVRSILDSLNDEDLEKAIKAYREVAQEYRYYPADPSVRRIARAFLEDIPRSPYLSGLEHLESALAAGPCAVISNHLSYADSQFTDFLPHAEGAGDLIERLVFVAGPKVYADPHRRMASISIQSLPTVQSARLGNAGLSAREIARIALGTVRQAHERMLRGDAVLLYPEGTRSRSGRLGSFLRATGRYLALEGASVVPIALTGADQAFPLHENELRPAQIGLTIGPAIAIDPRHPQKALEHAWAAVAEQLPPAYRPEPDTPAIA